MKTLNMPDLKEECLGQNLLPDSVLKWIENEQLWNIWVPKKYGGLEMDFLSGLMKLQDLAAIDGSLGWTVTLCSGANYFIGNLEPNTADKIFNSGKTAVLGGSGGAFGEAEVTENGYILNGKWKYATGAPYLTHFTLNAKLVEKGNPILNKNGNQKIISFVLPKEGVQPIDDWDMMGLQATATWSFEIENFLVKKEDTFVYNQFYLPQPIFKIPFPIFADLTLWVNYVGMASHYLKESNRFLTQERVESLASLVQEGNDKTANYVSQIEQIIQQEGIFNTDFASDLHTDLSNHLKKITQAIVDLHPLLGIKAASNKTQLNQIFKDFFTATQHHNFVRR